jgi:hypothetical protein
MNAFRMGLMAFAIMVVGGLVNETQAGNYVVRVQVENVFNGHTYYPTIYSSPDKKDAWAEFEWNEMLMKLYPGKFRTDVLNKLDVPWNYFPVRMHFVYLRGINPTGRP